MKKKALVDGPTGCLDPIKDDLLRWIFELRECGHAVDRSMVSTKASVLNHSFGEKSDAAKYAAVTRFLARMSLVYRMGTKESQRPPKEVGAEALDFIESARKKVAHRDKRIILNMDQTPVFFSMHSKKTLEKIGVRTVAVLTSTNDTRRVTVAATITASGEQLTPMVIFKGSPTGRIAKDEIQQYDHTAIYDVQKMHGWTNVSCCIGWTRLSNRMSQQHQTMSSLSYFWIVTDATSWHRSSTRSLILAWK